MKRLAHGRLLVLQTTIVLAAVISHFPVAAAPNPQQPQAVTVPPTALYAPPTTLSGRNAYFTILASTRSSLDAMNAVRRIQSRESDLTTAVYPHLPGSEVVWAVVSAAYASREEAQAHLAFVKRRGIARDAYILRITADQWAKQDSPILPFPPSVVPASFPNLLYPPSREVDQGYTFVSLARATSEDEIKQEAMRLSARYPELNTLIYPPRPHVTRVTVAGTSVEVPSNDETWRLMLAVNLPPAEVDRALQLANRLGIRVDEVLKDVKSIASNVWAPADERLYNKLVELRTKVDACIRSGTIITVGDLKECAGVIITPRQLATCLGKDDDASKEFLRKPVSERLRSLYENCVHLPDNQDTAALLQKLGLSLEAKLEIQAKYLLANPTMENLARCKNEKSPDDVARCMVPTLLNDEQKKQLECLARPTDVDRAKCLLDTAGQTQASSTLDCLSTARGNAQNAALCVLNDEQKASITNTTACIQQVSSQGALAEQCLATVLSNDEVQRLACLQKAKGDKFSAAQCAVSDANLKKALEFSACAKNASTDNAALARCAAAAAGGQAGEAAQCLITNRNDPLACVPDPNVQQARKVYQCVSAAGDVAAMIESCGSTGDDRARRIAACLARAGGDRARMAACAAQGVTDPETARLAGCVASSQGPTSFALCAAGPQMNEEWRIAAECAVSTGGEPISFATCAGGRLTVRELIKCFSGKIGTDCFGENNTIRKYYQTMFNDALSLLNGQIPENNDIVKGVKIVFEGLQSAGKQLEQDFRRSDLNPERVVDNWRRSDLNPGNWRVPRVSCCRF